MADDNEKPLAGCLPNKYRDEQGNLMVDPQVMSDVDLMQAEDDICLSSFERERVRRERWQRDTQRRRL